jgi:hypothetical protein
MARSPHLVTERDELRLEVAVGTTRRRFELSDRAENLLRDEGYAPTDVVPFVTAKALVLAGGATLPEKSDERDTAWELGGADGGRAVTITESEALADYLRSVTVSDRSLDALREHVRKHDLPVDPNEITGRADKVGGLSDIARNL